MARQCDMCGKKPTSGNNVSHSHRKTRRRWLPNLHRVSLLVDGLRKKVTVCSTCLKTATRKAA